MTVSSAGDSEELIHQAYELYHQREYSRARELFEEAFDGVDPYVAVHLGWIYNQKDLPQYDPVKSEEYYVIAAKAGLTSAHHGLAGLYYEQGKKDKALHHCSEASQAGNAECSWALQSIYKREGQLDLHKLVLNRAAEQGHPLAVQRRSIDDILLRNGARHFVRGLRLYFLNIRPLFRYVMKTRIDGSS
ncbi:hypothetical protein DC522_10595 [Microvirga sp. KLBC 81]|uniref:tetratricopeptide repeat protein n=1 Tax=Microvirga sp. KLBC 81 TaxID=1862707 RepID=UPI000D50C033|nr:sel1 repeat family protein [Microvirga sp. KLBC 81]PVE24519.1 hypothetical protein DC522_10595 [Microvirga sp. KLBC 81]